MRIEKAKEFYKPYDEEYARLCILRYFPRLAPKLELNKNDPPDLMDKHDGIGIEVVRAIAEGDAEIGSAYHNNLYKKEAAIKENLKGKIKKHGGWFYYDSESRLICARDSIKDNLYQLIGERIRSKTEKLNKSNYGQGLSTKYDYLFIYNSGGFCFDKDLGKEIDKIYKERLVEYPRRYTKIILYCDHDIFLYDVLEHKVVHGSISDKEIEEMKKVALHNAEIFREQQRI